MPAELATTLTATDEERLLQAEAAVRAYCGWHIAPVRTDDVVALDGPSSGYLLLPSLHVTAVASVVVDGEEVDPTTYTWTRGGVLRRGTGYTWGATPSGVTVTFTHGHDAPPPAVTAVVQAIAQRAVDNPRSLVRTQVGPFGDTYSQTGFNQSLPIAVLAAEKELLAPYALPKRL